MRDDMPRLKYTTKSDFWQFWRIPGYLKSGVVFMEIFQMPIKENSVAASPNNELMIFQ